MSKNVVLKYRFVWGFFQLLSTKFGYVVFPSGSKFCYNIFVVRSAPDRHTNIDIEKLGPKSQADE